MNNGLILESLVGNHIFSGIETGTRKCMDYLGYEEECCYIKFTLDGTTYLALEDPDDGYRSYMKELVIVDEVCNIKLPDIKVLCRMREYNERCFEENDVLEFLDALNGKLILAVGTGNINDYYPYCVLDYYPENMSCNEGICNG